MSLRRFLHESISWTWAADRVPSRPLNLLNPLQAANSGRFPLFFPCSHRFMDMVQPLQYGGSDPSDLRSPSDDPCTGLRRWSGNRRPLVVLRGDLGFSTRVTCHEKGPTEPPARQVRPSSSSPGNQPRRVQAPPNPHALGALRGGAGGTARADHPTQVLFLVPPPLAAGTASLELRRAVERHLSVRRLPLARRLDDVGGGGHCLMRGR